MIRRYETYAFLPGTPPEARARLAEVLGGAGRFIPEVLHCAVGWNRSGTSADLVWEHFFDSPESYRRYMVHPYHADLIDRYVLADSPERIVHTATGAGLFGYHCEDDTMVTGPGRRVLLTDLEPEADAEQVDELWSRLSEAAQKTQAVAVGYGRNTLATSWFDGVTTLPGPPPRWSHVWEAGYRTVPEESFDFPLASPPVRRLRELRYERMPETA